MSDTSKESGCDDQTQTTPSPRVGDVVTGTGPSGSITMRVDRHSVSDKTLPVWWSKTLPPSNPSLSKESLWGRTVGWREWSPSDVPVVLVHLSLVGSPPRHTWCRGVEGVGW